MKLTLQKAERLMAENNGNLRLAYSKYTSLPDNLQVGGWLDLEGCTSITSLPDNLQVGGWLDLRGTSITALPDGLVVAGNLYINETNISSLPNDLTVGGEIHADDHALATPPNVLRNGDYVEGRYIYVDGILTSIKKTKKVQGYTLYVGRLANHNVVSDGTHFAHCATLRDGIADLAFKSAKDRGAAQYKGLTLDSELTAEEIITMYRVITGACQQGTARFVASLGPVRDTYTIREAIEITKGQYNADRFAEFFKG